MSLRVEKQKSVNLTIQLIIVEWTKRSRGAPESIIRNAVPEIYPLANHPSSNFAIQEVWYTEFNQFRSPSVKWRTDPKPQQIAELRLELCERDGLMHVAFWGHPIREQYPRPKKICSLPDQSIARIRANARVVWEDTWAYQKHVYNIAWTKSTPSERLFFNQEPAKQFDDLVQIY